MPGLKEAGRRRRESVENGRPTAPDGGKARTPHCVGKRKFYRRVVGEHNGRDKRPRVWLRREKDLRSKESEREIRICVAHPNSRIRQGGWV